MLPEYAQARKAIWTAVNSKTGKRRIDEAFPVELRRSTNEQEMRIEFHSGSIWQIVGSDNFNSLVGSGVAGVTFSEWSIANPLAYGYIQPMLAENNGWATFIYTARGYNHGFRTYEGARNSPHAFAELLTVDDTGAISPEALEETRRSYMDLYGEDNGDSLFRQEFYNDWSAANIGAILGKWIEAADRQGRICDFEPDNEPVIITSDLGFRDTASWWFWQPKLGGFDLVDYMQGTNKDAEDWIEELRDRGWRIGKIWLPHDARVKTFQSKHSAVEQFLKAFGNSRVGVVPKVRKKDRINAARNVVKRCRFHKTNCEKGLDGLRSWSFVWDDVNRVFSTEPAHNWASHPSDAFSYGAQILSEAEAPPAMAAPVVVRPPTLNELWETYSPRQARI